MKTELFHHHLEITGEDPKEIVAHLIRYIEEIPKGIEVWRPKKMVLDIDYECPTS